ncbi:hypothetical protein PZA11_008032 [Diplocarpon coronariae]
MAFPKLLSNIIELNIDMLYSLIIFGIFNKIKGSLVVIDHLDFSSIIASIAYFLKYLAYLRGLLCEFAYSNILYFYR